MFRNKFCYGCSAIAIAVALESSSAFAAANPPVEGVTSDQGMGLEEVVVTAQKRAEPLQNVPIAITALTANMLESQGITSSDALSSVVPGLQLPRTHASQTPFIRGIGTANSAPGDESANAIYIDGVYRPSLPGGLFDFNGVERVEVLKGPQGTLFGRNALGGVINIITKDPSPTPALDAQIGYGNYDTVEGSLYATDGLGKNLAADVSAYYKSQGVGFVRNLYDGKTYLKGNDFSVRSKFRWQSDDARTEAVFSADYDDYYADTGVGTHAVGDAVLLDGKRNQGGFYTINTESAPFGRVEQYGASLTVRHDLDWARVVSISAYRKVRPTLHVTQEGTPARISDIYEVAPERTWSQELQLLSPSESKITWVTGLYYWNDDTLHDPLHLYGSLFNAFGGYRDTYADQSSASYAGFGQATVPILDGTNLTAGLRYTIDDRHITGYYITPRGILPGSVANQSASFPKLTWRYVLDHHFTEDVMAYLSYSRGFKSGLFNTVTPTDPAVRPSVLDAYEIGSKTQFLQNRLRINGAAFYYQYRDIQLRQVVPGGTRLLNAARAEVKGFDLDIEAAVTQRLRLQGSLTYLDGQYTNFPNAPYAPPRVNAAGVPIGGNLSLTLPNAAGNKTIDTPPITYSVAAQYEIPVEGGSFNFAVSAGYNDGFYRDPDNRLRQSSYTLLNGSIVWTSSQGWEVRLWGKNLLGAKYYSYETAGGVGDLGSPAPPLTFGGAVGVHF